MPPKCPIVKIECPAIQKCLHMFCIMHSIIFLNFLPPIANKNNIKMSAISVFYKWCKMTRKLNKSTFILFNAIFLLAFFSIKADEQHPENAAHPSSPWADYREERTNLWQTRQKRVEPFTTSALLMLFLWSGLAGPFIQAQLSLKVNVKSWFQKGGCVHRTYKNKFRSFCMPTEEEIFDKEFIQQVYMIIYSDVSEQTAQLLRYEHQQMLGIYEPPKMDYLSERESLFLLLLEYRLLPYGTSKEETDELAISKWLLNEEDKNSIKLYRRFNQVWGVRPDRRKCDHLKRAWMGKKAEKHYIPEEAFFELLKCECVRLQNAWGNSDQPIGTETIENCVTLLTSKTELPEMKDEEINEIKNSLRKEMEKVNEAADGDAKEKSEENIQEDFYDTLTYLADEDDEKEKIKIMNEEITGKETIEKMNEKREARERRRRDKMRRIWYDFLVNFDRKQQLGFLTRLEKNLLLLPTKKIDEIRPKWWKRQHRKVSAVLVNSSNSQSPSSTRITSSSYSNGSSGKSSGNVLERRYSDAGPVRDGFDDDANLYQCKVEFDTYGEECLVTLREQAGDGQEGKMKAVLSLNREQFGIDDKEYYYPEVFIGLLESAFKEAKEKFEDFLKKRSTSSLPSLASVGRIVVLIQMRRAVCQVYEYANEVEKRRKKRAITFFSPMKKWMLLFGIRKDDSSPADEAKTESSEAEEKIAKNLSREVFKELRNLCAKFYQRNLHERAQLLPVDGFRDLLGKNDEGINDGMEKGVVGNQQNKQATGIVNNDDTTNEHGMANDGGHHLETTSGKFDNKTPVEAEKSDSAKKSQVAIKRDDLNKKVGEKEKKSKANKLTDFLFGCFKESKSKKRRPKRNIYDKIFGTNFQNNHPNEGDNISGWEGGVPVRKKRIAIVTTLIGFSLSLIFLQIYLRIQHKYDPVKWLWMCMKYPKSWCQVPMPIQKELAFIQRANKIVVEEMSLETVAKIRKLFERHYYTSEHATIMEPSKYLAINGVNLLSRAEILLNCFTYNWKKYPKGKPANMDAILAKLIQIHSKSCIQFVGFMDKAKIPNKLIHISTHCSQPGGNL